MLSIALLIACGAPEAVLVPDRTRTELTAGGQVRSGGTVAPVVGDPPAADLVDNDDVLVYLGSPGPCPAPFGPGWSGEALFTDDEGEDDDDELARFCRYRLDVDEGDDSPFDEPPSDGEDQDLSASLGAGSTGISARLLMAPSSVDTAALNAIAAARFQVAAGQPVRETGRRAPADVPLRRQPRLVVVDSAPDSDIPFPFDDQTFQSEMSHGLALFAGATLLTCPGGTRCPVQVATTQALPRTQVRGGDVAPPGTAWGTPGDLAVAVVRAVRAWDADRARGRVGPLILNLSVAWHPFYGGGPSGGYTVAADGATIDVRGGVTSTFDWDDVDPTTFPSDVRAAFEALLYARCRGALIFAAAGNVSSGPKGQSGPMFPAAWEAFPADRLRCANGAPPPEPQMPLLHAVGGVGADGQDLSVARPESRPKLVAYGDHFWFDPSAVPVETGPNAMTGSSVAALVASSAAAMIAARHPAPTARNIIDVMIRLGVPSSPVAGWATAASAPWPEVTGGPTAGSRVVRVCAPLVGRGYSCPSGTPALAGFGEASDAPTAVLDWAVSDAALDVCPNLVVHPVPQIGDVPAYNPCPTETRWSPSISPWVIPQPPTDGCSVCFIDTGRRRLGIYAPDLSGWTDLTLMVDVPAGRLAWSLPALPAGPWVVLSWGAGAGPTQVTAAALTGVQADRTLSVPIHVLR